MEAKWLIVIALAVCLVLIIILGFDNAKIIIGVLIMLYLLKLGFEKLIPFLNQSPYELK